MTNSPRSDSRRSADRAASPSTAFSSFDPRIQRWIWDQGWRELRDIQEAAAAPILARQSDVIIASGTASGKTEAAFLPICSTVVASRHGLKVLCISPLKALINDQYERLLGLCTPLDLAVHRWHGDVSASRKKQALTNPSGILLITPESLEALFIIHGPRMSTVFADVEYVVIDELHAFIGSERGMQLQSLLHRVEHAVNKRIPRIALSATLGDLGAASKFLRPGDMSNVQVINSSSLRQEIRLQIRGYRTAPPGIGYSDSGPEGPASSVADELHEDFGDAVSVASDVYAILRGGRHLAFANSRTSVEVYADILRRLSERDRVPSEFWPHHGSLAKTLREDAESTLKDESRPATIIATTTLELGIDVGSVESIAQIGPPSSVASLRQRLGRSGRRSGTASILRVFIQEEEITPHTPPQDALRANLVQTIAAVRLLVQNWIEPPDPQALHLSTLVQQILSLIAQYGGITASQAWRVLCEQGPFSTVDKVMFTKVLRSLASCDLITQLHDGSVVLGLDGERLINHFDFYAAFTSPIEYRLVAGGTMIGSMPVSTSVVPGMRLIFGGRRWEVIQVDSERKVIELSPAGGGRPPKFSGSGALVHDRVRAEMLNVYRDHERPAFLDRTAQDLLSEGREWFQRFKLDHCLLMENGKDTLWFPWCGDRTMNTLLVQLTQMDLNVDNEGIAILIHGINPEGFREKLASTVENGVLDSYELAIKVQNKETEKHHRFLTEDLLAADYAASSFDVEGSMRAIRSAITGSIHDAVR